MSAIEDWTPQERAAFLFLPFFYLLLQWDKQADWSLQVEAEEENTDKKAAGPSNFSDRQSLGWLSRSRSHNLSTIKSSLAWGGC